MEEGSQTTGYWCYECSRAVETIMEVETIKCLLCHGGFVEELDISRSDNHNRHCHQLDEDSESGRALSLWSPILLGMVSNPRRPRRFRQIEPDNENRDDNDSELNRELQSIMRRRRRSSTRTTTILHLLQRNHAGMITESDDNRERDHERVFVINPFNQRIIVQGAIGGRNPFNSGGPQQNQPIGLLGDYFIGPDMELLMQHLAENSLARYGTPPAQRKVVETMPTVKINQDLNNLVRCSVCLEDFEDGNEAKEMPCKHRFHGECILTWLDLHSTCPVCRYQLPSDESKLKQEQESSRSIVVWPGPGSGSESGESGQVGNMGDRSERRISVMLTWPFNSLLTSTSETQNMNPPLIINTSISPGSDSGSAPTGQEGGGGRDDEH